LFPFNSKFALPWFIFRGFFYATFLIAAGRVFLFLCSFFCVKVPPISGETPTELKLHKLWQGEEKFCCVNFSVAHIFSYFF